MIEYTLTKEKEMHSRLEELMNRWRGEIEKHSSQEMAAKYEVGNMAELFVTDGFYPYYTEQKKRILFVGRESLGLQGYDYIDVLREAIADDKEVGGKPLNTYKFHALMIYVAYGILNGYPKYGTIPYATVIADHFACEGGLSFAFMNLSKFSNESEENWQSDSVLMRSFIETDGYIDFFADELRILNPDVVIGMNLVNEYGQYMGAFHDKKPFGSTGQVDAYTLRASDGHDYLFLDCYHFSAPNKSWEDDYYIPIIEACKMLMP